MNATRTLVLRIRLAAQCLLGLSALLDARGAEAVPPLVSTVSTTTLDASGRPWAYLVFDANKPGLLAGKTFGIYLKSGTADSASIFAFRGVATATKDPVAINVLLSRAASVGDNNVALEAQVVGLHRLLINNVDSSSTALVDPPPMPLNQRLAAVLNRAEGDTALAGMVDLLGYAHPAVRFARGTAWAGPLGVAVGADVTLEVRERSAAGTDGAVIARVSFKAGQPATLPAPGPLVVVPDTTANGDLATKLRWATPDALRQAGSRHHGDLVWRVSRTFAESHGFVASPPNGTALDALAISNTSDVKRVGGPIFASKLFGAADVADFSLDATTSFFTDNNDRYAAGGSALPEGAQFYYFTAAGDALGRPGPACAGVLATFCVRVPPRVPTGLVVGNVWTQASAQMLDVKWRTNTVGDGTSTSLYEIFRGDDLAAHAAAQRGELDLDANPIIPASPGSIERIAVVDDPAAVPPQLLHVSDRGADASDVPAIGKTWWFAVRAVHAAPPGCDNISSSLGPPAFGALRDRTAPPAPAAADVATTVDCLRVACVRDVDPIASVSPDSIDASVLRFTVQCQRINKGVSAAHIHVTTGATEVVPETVLVFPEDIEPTDGGNVVSFSWTAPLSMLGSDFTVQCRAETPGGFLSDWATADAAGVDPSGNQFMLYHFLAGAISESERLDDAHAANPLWASLGPPPADWPQDLHLAYSPDTGHIVFPHFTFPFAANAEQFRVYRRIDDGPLTLIKQGLRNGAVSLAFDDEAPPSWNAHVHYFTQMLDENGRGSAMLKLKTLRFTGDTPPTPVLLTPKPADFGGNAAAPTLTLSWICPPEHVDRFEVFFKTANPPSPSGNASGISAVVNLMRRPLLLPSVHATRSKYDFSRQVIAVLDESFLTGRVGGGLGAGPKFTVTMNLDPNLKYTVWLRALGPNGETGDSSRTIDFKWQAPGPPPANIAWPARPLPPVAAFNSGITVIDFSDVDPLRYIWRWNYAHNQPTLTVTPDQTPVGIRVGSVPVDYQTLFSIDSSGNLTLGFRPGYTGFGKSDPNAQLYPNSSDATQKLLPFVLYRQQVVNAAYPSVSGDVIQVSPLIAKIPTVIFNDPNVALWTQAKLLDPFFRWLGPGIDLLGTTVNPAVELYLVDTQPVVGGAQYRYWLTRFNAFNEPVQTIPCGEITIQSAR